MSLFDGATHTSPIDTVASRSNWCSKVMPLLLVLSRPPEAVAIQKVVGSSSQIETAVMRPPMFAGPMQRQVSGLSHSGDNNPSAAFGSAAGARQEDNSRTVRIEQYGVR